VQLRSAYSNNRYCLDEYLERQLSSKSCRSITDRGGRRRDSGMARMGEDPGYDVDRAESISSHLVGLCHAHDCPRRGCVVLCYCCRFICTASRSGSARLRWTSPFHGDQILSYQCQPNTTKSFVQRQSQHRWLDKDTPRLQDSKTRQFGMTWELSSHVEWFRCLIACVPCRMGSAMKPLYSRSHPNNRNRTTIHVVKWLRLRTLMHVMLQAR